MIRPFNNEDDAQYNVDAHWRIYTSEYQYDDSFIEFFTEPIIPFSRRLDPNKENIWILDINNKPKGTISIMKIDEDTAQLRWFLIESEERGHGYGKQMIEQAIQFCRDSEYKTVFLWTNNILSAARHLYGAIGFKHIRSKERVLSNQNIMEEKWELIL